MTPDTQRIQTVLSGGKESLWHYLAQLPTTWEAQLFYAILIGGLMGMFAHYINKFIRNETAGWCFLSYLTKDHPRRTVMSFFTVVGVGCTAIATGAFETSDGQFVGWWNVLWVSVTNGFMCDALVNKSAGRKSWTAEERAARKLKGGDPLE